jgi:flagellar hook-associated protein 2
MPVLQAGGIGSGLDVAGLVSQLVAAERDPVANRLDLRESELNAKLSAWGQVKSALGSLQTALEDLKDATAFQQRSTTSSDDTVATATATTSAALGSYSLTVNTLAAAHKLRTSFGVADTDTTSVGTGTLHISIGGGAATDVPVGGGTLAEIRDAINTNVSGVTAVIINDGSNNYLSITSDDTGTANDITITATDTGDGNDTDNFGLSRLINANMTETTPATDASFVLDGVTITSSSNTVTSAISGVTLELLQDGGATTDITIGADTAAAKDTITSFVDAYNKAITTINSVSKYTEGASSQGPLLSDSMVRGLKSSLQRIVGDLSSNGGAFSTLTELGYATSTDNGTLTLKSSTDLDAALSSNFDDVGLIMADIATQVDDYVDPYLGTTGLIQGRTDGLGTQLDDIATQRERLDYRIEKIQERYTRQFSALDALIANMNSTMNYLSQQLATLPGAKS